jgi:hypothetical protein
MSFTQDYSANAMLAALIPAGGYRGITGVQNGSTANSIDISVNTTRAYAVLKDGIILNLAALTASAGVGVITGVANGAQSIWVGSSADGKETPTYYAAVAATMTRDIAVATFTASAGAIGTVTVATAGLVL